MNFKKIEKFVKKHKKIIYSFFGFIIGFQLLFLAIWFFAVINSIIYYNSDNVSEPLKYDRDLVTADSLSKAVEMEVLLVKHGLRPIRFQDGTKTRLVLPRYRCRPHKRLCTHEDYELAIVLLSKNGIGKNAGFELFDKSNIFSTKEEVRMKLVRTMNQDLANLIRKLEGIEDAEVMLSIPEQAMFTKDQEPVRASVQVTTSGDELLNERTRDTIMNILLGAVAGLSEENIKLTDTRSNIYTMQ